MSGSPRYCLAELAYPQPYRTEHYSELLATANELSDDTWSSHQGWSLLANGLRTRSRVATKAKPAAIWRSAIRIYLIVELFLMSTFYMAHWHGVFTMEGPPVVVGIILGALLGLVVHAYRVAAVFLTALAGILCLELTANVGSSSSSSLLGEWTFVVLNIVMAVAMAAGACWIAADSRSTPVRFWSRHSLLATTVMLGAFVLAYWAIGEFRHGAIEAIFLGVSTTLLAAALLVGWAEPRLPAAFAVFALGFAVSRASFVLIADAFWPEILVIVVPLSLGVMAVPYARWSRGRLVRI